MGITRIVRLPNILANERVIQMKSKNRRVLKNVSVFIALIMLITLTPGPALAIVQQDPLRPGSVGQLEEPGDVLIEKWAEQGETEHEYDVTLTIQGKNTVNPVTTDIVLVFDRSGSMSGSKINDAKDEAKMFVDTLLTPASTSIRIGLVSFASSVSANVGLTDDPTALKSAIDGLSADGGTHIQEALVQAKNMLLSSSAQNQIIVLLSDGEPTYSTEATEAVYSTEIPGWNFKLTGFNNTVRGTGSSINLMIPYNVTVTDTVYEVTVQENGVPTISQSLLIQEASPGIEIFSIGFDVATNSDAIWVLRNVASSSGNYYPAEDANDLAAAFQAIAESVVAPVINGVVTDPIGEMFEYVPGSESASQGAVSYNPTTRVLSWNVGTVPEGVVAELTYRVTMNIDHPEFESGAWYPLNGTTTLDHDQEMQMEFLVPEAMAIVEIFRMEIEKTADREEMYVGDTANYTITVRNTGNMTLEGVLIEDALLGINETVTLSVYPDEGWNYVITGSLQGESVGALVNTAEAMTEETGTVEDSWTVDVQERPIEPVYNLSISKSADRSSIRIGQTVNYTIIVTNTGNMDLEGIQVVDELLGIDETIDLEAGESTSFTGSITGELVGQIVNTATAVTEATGEVEDSVTVDVRRRSSGGGDRPPVIDSDDDEIDIPEEEPPLTIPEEEPVDKVIIEEDNDVIIEEEDVPLDLPKTGDSTSALLLLPTLMSLAGYAVCKKRN